MSYQVPPPATLMPEQSRPTRPVTSPTRTPMSPRSARVEGSLEASVAVWVLSQHWMGPVEQLGGGLWLATARVARAAVTRASLNCMMSLSGERVEYLNDESWLFEWRTSSPVCDSFYTFSPRHTDPLLVYCSSPDVRGVTQSYYNPSSQNDYIPTCPPHHHSVENMPVCLSGVIEQKDLQLRNSTLSIGVEQATIK
jgi:hypothetical protein